MTTWRTKLDGLNGGTYIVIMTSCGGYRWDYFRGHGPNLGHGVEFPNATDAADDLLTQNGTNVQWQDGCDLIGRCKEHDLHMRIRRAA